MSAIPDKLVFRSNSADKKPGKGVHEYVANPAEYIALSNIKDFRRYWSNFDDSCTFVWQGPFDRPYTFRSNEHAFHAAKIHIASPSEALKFTVESGHTIGAGDGLLARKYRKLVKLTPDQLAIHDSRAMDTLSSIAEAKYLQNPESMPAKALKASNRAELWHLATARGKPSELIRFEFLEKIRERLLVTRV